MVSVARIAANDSAEVLETVAVGLDGPERDLVARALDFAAPVYAGKTLGTGEGAMQHAIGVARRLAELKLDGEARAGAILFGIPSYLDDAHGKLDQEFGAAVTAIVEGIARLNTLRVVTRGLAAQEKSASKAAQAEVLRKMLLAMVEDIRVVIIRLASRTQTLAFIAKAPDEVRRPVAQETLDLYAPLANRLGIWQLKWELEDMSFRFLEPELYKRIASMLDEKRAEREAFIAEAMATLRRELAAASVQAELAGRPKHIFSIYNKMRGKGLDFSDLYDVRALRIIVDSVKDCYTALGVVHNLWTPIPKEFDDYISRPKANNYRSLHTAVSGPDGRPVEVQIRTREMHRHAELGVAAHWRYKENAKHDPFDEKIALLRQVLAWRDEVVDASDWKEQFKRAALDETVYVLTPQGRVVDLARGATPIDFAYALHTDLGHRCRGAKVDGVMVPLDYKLQNGQRVEIIAAKTGGPSRDWLNPSLGYLASSRAKNKVRQWFNATELAQTIADGRTAVEREMQREGQTGASLDALAQKFGFDKTDEFFAAVGREVIRPREIQNALRGESGAVPEPETVVAKKSKAESGGSGILIVGVDRLLTQLAKCCKPAPPDGIVGFVTRGRGVSIHRASCKSLAALLRAHPERTIEAHWGEQGAGIFAVDVIVQAHDRQGLLRDISEVFSRQRINVTAVNTASRQHVATMAFTVEVGGVDQLARTLAEIRDVPGVFSAGRR
ncbi:MAG: bifunctional (p)ppGpp synthetase/guanosine-3',5'-bis(diphosphate) 3'-pyrophosphohydrolase [Burkholderiales bacterium]|jgi:GTP pyrophosphokinase|nr:bifunctional (p)ppGpp synthetase/guanosine-3',5'-bis(diphosphate) 3'-pyrophosphohydrolase [Burkholderiales bacterium]